MQNPKENSNKKIRLGIPKGSLQDYTLRVFREAGFNIEVPERSYILKIDDPEIECFLLRPQEIPKYVEDGKLDVGISGNDWILETRADVVEACDLEYAKTQIKKVKWVLAVPQDSSIKSVKELEDKTIATEIVNLTKDYLKKHNVQAKVVFSWGATEVKPPIFSDAVVDLTETGSSLRAHHLKVLETILESSTKLVANKDSFQNDWKKEKIMDLSLLLQGTVQSEQITSLMLHVPTSKLNKVLEILKECKPSVRKLVGEPYYFVALRCGLMDVRTLIPRLKKLECEGIIESPIARFVP